jgi:hypothetical protein
MYKMHHPKADTDRLRVKRKEGGSPDISSTNAVLRMHTKNNMAQKWIQY